MTGRTGGLSSPGWRVPARFWDDTVGDGWDGWTRLLALWLATGPLREPSTVFRCPRESARAAMGWTAQRVDRTFAELARLGFVVADPESDTVFAVGVFNPDEISGMEAEAAVAAVATGASTGFLYEVAARAGGVFGKAIENELGGPTLPGLPLPTPKTRVRSAEASMVDVRRVFDTWVEAAGKNARTKLDGNRVRIIRKALALYPVEDVLDAVRGWKNDPFYCGDNDRQKTYNDLDLLLRDAKQIEKFRDLARGAPRRRCQNPTAATVQFDVPSTHYDDGNQTKGTRRVRL